MKHFFLILFVSVAISVAAQTKRVLFLGNSYTYSNNMPQLVSDIATSMGDTLIFDSNTPGGYTLEGHCTNSTTFDKISEGNWDFVSLQEQSQRPALRINQVITDVFPYAEYLDSLVNYYNPCGETIFFMTWGRKNGDSYYCPEWPPVCTYQGMDSLLRLRYMIMADSNDAVVSPVGAVWKYIRENHPEIELYTSDESHPSLAGSYAAACSFYTAMFRDDPTLISYNPGLEIDLVNKIKNATKLIVYDSLLLWHVGEYDLKADFEYENIEGGTFQFINLSQNAESYLWDFGETTDTTANPMYTFPHSGEHNVTLAATDECDTFYIQKTITIESINNINSKIEGLSISQNNGSIVIANSARYSIDVAIFDISGKRVYSQICKDDILKTERFRKGVYLIKIGSSGLSESFKIAIW